jgi:hypothetical protein
VSTDTQTPAVGSMTLTGTAFPASWQIGIGTKMLWAYSEATPTVFMSGIITAANVGQTSVTFLVDRIGTASAKNDWTIVVFDVPITTLADFMDKANLINNIGGVANFSGFSLFLTLQETGTTGLNLYRARTPFNDKDNHSLGLDDKIVGFVLPAGAGYPCNTLLRNGDYIQLSTSDITNPTVDVDRIGQPA